MIDCGTTKRYLFEHLKELQISLDDLDAVLITHNHSDHISQIKHFAHYQSILQLNTKD